jgi:hypothetical protein
MYPTSKDSTSIKTILHTCSLANSAKINHHDQQQPLTNSSPLQLLLTVDFLKHQDSYIINNLLNFFNISLSEISSTSNDPTVSPASLSSCISETKKVIEQLNFIRFKHDHSSPTPDPIGSAYSRPAQKTCIPSFSIILLTNNAQATKSFRQVMENDDSLRLIAENNGPNNSQKNHLLRASTNWSYKYFF